MSLDLKELISPDIQLFSLEGGPFLHKHPQLIVGINKWKSVFKKYDLKENATIGVIHTINFEYICILYAAISSGFNFVILDSRFDDHSSHKQLLPLDIVVYNEILDYLCDSIDYWHQNAVHLIDSRQIPPTTIDEQDHHKQLPLLDFDLKHHQILSSVTSGTTSVPKKVLHNYQYFIDIAKRNSKVLDLTGKVAHLKNLHHGSSLPVFFLPTIMSCNFHLCLTWIDQDDTDDEQKKLNLYDLVRWTEYLDINHILCPHSDMLSMFLEIVERRNMQFTNLKLYTLYYINPYLKKYIKNKNIEIISIFGCTETSGPVMLNKLNNNNADIFDPTIFYAPDDFFIIELKPAGTRIRSKCGTIDHFMHDKFTKLEDNCYQHLGRSNFYRINDVLINLDQLQKLKNNLNIDGEIVIDLPNQTLYLALWDQSDPISTQNQINKELKKIFKSNLIYVSKSANLKKINYMSGIKPNQELVRNYFRLLEEL
jgi:acyl-CoA synthetase (AMP-forming)/AMP-acid ligase II